MNLRRDAIRRSRKGGFTMMEMMIVIALIALILGLAIGQLGGIFEDSKKELARQFVSSAVDAPLLAYKLRMGSYPTTAQGLQALLTAPEGASKWSGPYIKGSGIPEDPWKNPYQYRCPGTKNPNGFDLFSYGPDGVESADDIGNW